MRLSKKQRALALALFGTDKLTRRQFSKMMDERKQTAEAAYDKANDKGLLDLAEKHTTMTPTGNTRTGPCPMPGCRASKDGFWVDTRSNTGGCHSCFWPRGVGSGPVGFIRALTGCEAWEARDQLIGKIEIEAPETRRERRREPSTTEATKDFEAVMRDATANLRGSDGLARWGRRYLTGRGIKQETWERFGIGVVSDFGNRGFVASPFHHLDSGNVCGIRYSNAKISATESKFVRGAFGLPALSDLPVAFVVEGEVNGLSIWQVCNELGHSVDVVSVGSQGAFKSLAPDLAERLRKAAFIVIWADEEVVGRAVEPIFAVKGPLVSVLHSYSKLDANDLLKSGQLSSLLPTVLPKEDFFATPVEAKNEEVVTSQAPEPEPKPTNFVIQKLLDRGNYKQAKTEAHKIKNVHKRGAWLRRIVATKKEAERKKAILAEVDTVAQWEALRKSATGELQNNALFL
ncbi:MAG: hypothetical protein ACPGWR_00140 [Ardenticatenaceae bacterium]